MIVYVQGLELGLMERFVVKADRPSLQLVEVFFELGLKEFSVLLYV
jgi:hypothetical protein